MNANIKNILVAVNKLYGFLNFPVNLYFLKPSEFSYSMINMYNIISRVQTGELLDRDTFLFCKESLDPEFMIPVEDLVISIDRNLQIVIGKSPVKIKKKWYKMNIRVDLIKDILQSFYLRLTFGNDESFVSIP